MHVGDSPAPAHLDDALELAEILRPTWPAISEENRRTAAFLNEGEEETETGGDQPSPEDADSQVENNGADEGPEASFLDAYDLGEVTDPQARAVAEAWIKRVNAGYTRQRQTDAQAVRDAQRYQTIVEGLEDPNAAPAILQAFGIQMAPDGEEPDEFEFEDPIERIEALEAKLAQRDEVTAAEDRVRAENAYVTGQIEDIQGRLDYDLSEEEIDALAALAFSGNFVDVNGVPDVEAAFRSLEAIGASHRARALKPRPRAPRRPGQGSAGERQVDLDDPEKRLEAGLAAARAVLASSD